MQPRPIKKCLIAALTVASAICISMQAQTATKNRAQKIIRTLGLKPLPKEAGYLGLIGSSAQTIPVNNRTIAIQSQVYYMLTRDSPINYLHWLASDDTHILIEGGPVDYFIFHPDGRAEKLTLGRDFAHVEAPSSPYRAAAGRRFVCTKARSLRSWRMRSRRSSLPTASASAKARPG